jgi:DNA-binding response OmpR family regulator
MHIMHLRTKLRDRDQEMLVTVRGKGWRFHTEETP